uniref:NR LBD domain-containing protein n=1 Tax=Caenorhabditis tropicalis TaxID=1561998 RepID=A0A1I7V243_9PELO
MRRFFQKNRVFEVEKFEVQKYVACKPCRLQKCFQVGMETANFQYHRDTLRDSKTVIPQTLECFVGRPEMILFWDSQKPTHKTYIDVTFLIDEASKIFKQPSERIHISKSRLHRLSLGSVIPSVKNYKFVTQMTQKDVAETWQFRFLTVAKWLTHFQEFEDLDGELKLTILQTIWHIWSILDYHSLAATHRKIIQMLRNLRQ